MEKEYIGEILCRINDLKALREIIYGHESNELEGMRLFIESRQQWCRDEIMAKLKGWSFEKESAVAVAIKEDKRTECSYCLRFVYPEEDNTCRYCDHTL